MSRSLVLTLAGALLCALLPACALANPPSDGSLFGLHRPPPSSPPSLTFTYRGWRVDAQASRRAQPPAMTVRLIEAQIDLVERIRLPSDILGFMRMVPIDADPSIGRDAATYGPDRAVSLRVRRLDPKRPALLYGLLQAYHEQRLPGGFANRDIDGFRHEILARRLWPKAALMLQDDQHFFALTASAYLYGAITREPYTRTDLEKTQPDYAQWLARLFDAGKMRR